MWNREELAWAAGVIEGEGCFMMHPKLQNMSIRVSMCDRDILERLQNIFGGRIHTKASVLEPRRKPCWTWALSKRDLAYAVMAALYRFMGNRRKFKIRECISYYKTLPELFSQKRGPKGPKKSATISVGEVRGI